MVRECRGLIFNAETGEVISRRLHKFFNIGELPETQAEKVDITRPHIILEKMDG
jgi:RNA ligase